MSDISTQVESSKKKRNEWLLGLLILGVIIFAVSRCASGNSSAQDKLISVGEQGITQNLFDFKDLQFSNVQTKTSNNIATTDGMELYDVTGLVNRQDRNTNIQFTIRVIKHSDGSISSGAAGYGACGCMPIDEVRNLLK